VVIASGSYRSTEQTLVQINRADDSGTESKELGVVVRVVARLEQIAHACTTDGPVDVLAGTVDAGERLFSQEADETMLSGDPLQERHREHLVIVCNVRRFVNRSYFELRWGDFVVASLDRDTQFEALALGLHHASEDAIRDGAEVLVFELLTLGRLRTEEGAATGVNIRTEVVETGID
jgi:hypothetical protein